MGLFALVVDCGAVEISDTSGLFLSCADAYTKSLTDGGVSVSFPASVRREKADIESLRLGVLGDRHDVVHVTTFLILFPMFSIDLMYVK